MGGVRVSSPDTGWLDVEVFSLLPTIRSGETVEVELRTSGSRAMQRVGFTIAVVSLGLGVGLGSCGDGDDREPSSDCLLSSLPVRVVFRGW